MHTTLARTGRIALVVGAVLARLWGGLARWPLTTLLAFWFSFGGHWVELVFLNGCALACRSWPSCRPGLAFIGIELVIHLALQLSGRPSVYNGRG